MRKHLIILGKLALLFNLINLQELAAQNTSPFWSLAGNSNASSTTSKLGTTNAINLGLFTNNVERVHINYSNGYVGIGTTAPSYKLHVANTATSIYGQSTGGYGVYGNSGSGTYAGVFGVGPSTTGTGIKGFGGNYGAFDSSNNGGIGVYGGSKFVSGKINTGVFGRGYYGVQGIGTNTGVYGSGTNFGVSAISTNGYGIYGHSVSLYGGYFSSDNSDGLDAVTGNGYYGVYASCGNSQGVGSYSYSPYMGEYGNGGSYGIYGISSSGQGIHGESINGLGAFFHSTSNWALEASTDNGSYAGVFYGNVFTSGTYVGSDRRLKKNIEDVNDAISIINKLQPKYYEFKTDEQYKALHLPTGMHYGLIAQDLEQVLPNLVHEEKFALPVKSEAVVIKPKTADGKDENNYQQANAPAKTESMDVKAVNYTELIPIMVKAMQEMNSKNEELEKKNNDLEARLKKLEDLVGKNILAGNGYSLDAASLEQNTPNPFNSATIIRYHIPQNAASAKVVITDATGRTMKTISLTSRGAGEISLNSGTLAAGSYNYTLWIDGKQVGCKKMIIAK